MQQRLSLSQLFSRHQLQGNPWGDDGVSAAGGFAVAPWDSFANISTDGSDIRQQRLQAEGEWLAGIAALAQLLMQTLPQAKPCQDTSQATPLHGVVISGPFPVLPDRLMGHRLSTWLLVPEPLDSILAVARPLLPANGYSPQKQNQPPACDLHMVPLATDDPVATERFCLLLTENFSLALMLGPDANGRSRFHFSFEPELIQQIWQHLRDRIAHTRPPLLSTIDPLVNRFPAVEPDYRLVSQFSRLLVNNLQQRNQSTPAPETSPVKFAALESPGRKAWSPVATAGQAAAEQHFARRVPFFTAAPSDQETSGSDTELLKAMAHEIRTPLTTIRTFTRSLLKRKDISEDVAKRLRLIDRECTQQIDRFNLIFRAVELETNQAKKPQSPLSPISLNQLFEDAIPLWQQQASRRNLTLQVDVPPSLPMVASDPTMLNQVLTGLIDRFTHSLPPYSHIELAVTLAGHQLKLQFQSQPPESDNQNHPAPDTDSLFTSPFKALGQLLMFQPETGGLSLNLNATKNLFQALGGKLIVRQRPQAGEVLTVFLPLETRTL
jgi:signal transduction histidine kinase